MVDPNHTLTVIAVTFNEAKCIASLKSALDRVELPAGVRLETIVVDGGSRDGTPHVARQAGFDKVIVADGGNIPVCRNRGLRESSGDWIAYLDGDCEPAPDWLKRAHPFMVKYDALILGWPAQPPEPMTWVQAAWQFHWAQKNPHWDTEDGIRVVRREGFRLVTTRNMILHKAVADRIGGFNEDLATGEDTDFAFRAHQSNIPVIGLPGLAVIHRTEPATLREFFRQQLWHANRRSYAHIRKLSGGKVGGNAPRFTMLFLASSILSMVGVAGLLVTGHWSLACFFLPLAALITGPALALSLRGKTLRHFPALCALYAAYGLARSFDLIGLHPHKPSWKSNS